MPDSTAHHRIPRRGLKPVIVSGMSALITLMMMMLNIGGVDGFSSMLFTLSPSFILISLMAGLVGLFFSNLRTRWSALIGMGVGVVGGLAIVAYSAANV